MKLITIVRSIPAAQITGRILEPDEIVMRSDWLNARSNFDERDGWIPADKHNAGERADHSYNAWALVLRPLDPLIVEMIRAKEEQK